MPLAESAPKTNEISAIPENAKQLAAENVARVAAEPRVVRSTSFTA